MGLLSIILGQFTGRRSNKHGEKGPGRERREVASQVYHSLKPLIGQKYDHLKNHETAHAIADDVVRDLQGGDRDGWEYQGKENAENIKRALVSKLMHKFHFTEKQAYDIAGKRIIPIVWKHKK